MLYFYDLLYVDEKYFLFQYGSSLIYNDKNHKLNPTSDSLSPVGFKYLHVGDYDPYSFLISNNKELAF